MNIVSAVNENTCICSSADPSVLLQRMFCTVCYQGSLPERKFKKKDRKVGCGICLPCQGVVNRYYTASIKGIRKPGKTVRNECWKKLLKVPDWSSALDMLTQALPGMLQKNYKRKQFLFDKLCMNVLAFMEYPPL